VCVKKKKKSVLKERGRYGGWGQSSFSCSCNNSHIDGDDDLTLSVPGECLGSVFGEAELPGNYVFLVLAVAFDNVHNDRR